MPTQKTLNAILDACLTTVTGLGLIDTSGNLIPVVKRKAPSRRQKLDAATQITICGADAPDQIAYAAFGVQWWTYTVLVTTVAPNIGMSLGAENVPTYVDWRERVRTVFLPPFTSPVFGVPGVFDMRLKPQTFLNRGQLSANYDYQQLAVEFTGTN